MDEEQFKQLKDEIRNIKERLTAIEREQRFIRQDILSDDPKAHMQKRMLSHPTESYDDRKEKINNKIKIEI